MPYIIALIVILFICFLVGLIVAKGIIKPKKRSLLDTSILEENKFPGIMDFYKKAMTKSYFIESKYGYNLQAYYFENKIKTNQFIVMAHGHTYTHHGCLKYARMMLNHGYNVLLYDERFHGNSGGKFTSLGHNEKEDLYTVITDTIERFGDDITIGTYGESMGAATVLLEAKLDSRVKFVISDCGFSDLEALIKELLWKRYHIPTYPFYYFAVLIFNIITKTKMKGISPIRALRDVNVPVMFVHGLDDDFISYKHTQKMYDAYKGDKQIFLAGNGAYHAGSYHMDKENYEKNISEFINKYIHKN